MPWLYNVTNRTAELPAYLIEALKTLAITWAAVVFPLCFKIPVS